MSFLGRSVPLKYAILGAIVVAAVFAGMAVHQLQSRSDSIAHYGKAIPAKVVEVDEPKTVGSIFGLGGSTYTNARVEVFANSNEPWYYANVPVGGHATVGEEMEVWFYDNNPNSAYFSNWFEKSSEETYDTPWPSVGRELLVAFLWTFLAAVVVFIVLKLLAPRKPKKPRKPRKRTRPASSGQKPVAM